MHRGSAGVGFAGPDPSSSARRAREIGTNPVRKKFSNPLPPPVWRPLVGPTQPKKLSFVTAFAK
jgi:hypothetical protein